MLTHGWASKAADFFELITELRKIDDLEIIAFDAPGNGSSESELSNVILYAESVKAIATGYAKPNFLIGHSLGGMANVLAIQDDAGQPELLISIAPLIRLRENFEQSMQSMHISEQNQQKFFKDFDAEFPVSAGYFNLTKLYQGNRQMNHFLAYDPEDTISPYPYLNEFLSKNALIEPKAYQGIGHYRILKSAQLIMDIIARIKSEI